MRSSFYIAFNTRELYDPDQYSSEAGKLVNALQQLLGDSESIASITKPNNLTACNTEVEIAEDDEGLVAKCVVDIEAPNRVQIDKSKLSALFKSSTHWSRVKIEKRAVSADE